MTDRSRWNGRQIVAFAIALVFGAATALGLVVERMDLGGAAHATWISAAIMASVVLMIIAADLCNTPRVAEFTRDSMPCSPLGPQALGAILPVIAVHTYLAIAAHAGRSSLVEGPAQLVNDVVLVFGLFGLVQGAVARRRSERLLWIAIAALLVAAYARTADCWHRDPFDGLAVQRYVIGQVTAAASGIFLLLALRFARRSRR